MPSPGGKPAPRPRAPAPKVQVPPVSIGRGPAPLPPRMQPPRPAPMPPRMPAPAPRPMPQPPAPAPMPDLPYGGPITMPGGPFTPRPDLGPGVGFGPGLPPPGMPTPGMPGGKSDPSNPFYNNFGNQLDIGSPPPMDPAQDPSNPSYNNFGNQLDMGGGPQMIGGAYGKPIYGGRPSPMPPSMYSQPQPNFASALGTSSPFLNSVQR